ncbi:PREDICTED: probable transcriptional regulatory protein Cthe_2075 [Eufriesea mexicana]|uniref:probable transcriptional regulatory protein Cthe_2075 n=1 Tax=Eufriesea mexicana TaxID=516756 RepID=UPI00083C179B|nr:PREDICTED: probable transcriptional regulatory protein Cthe_2075 [Eufriesea mexicana]
MQYLWKTLIYRHYRNILIQNETKRYAGHSKWKNIKDIKESQDKLRMTTFRMLAGKMRAVVEQTGDADPTTNYKLANLIAESKKVYMPAATLKTILDRLKNPPKGDTHVVTICPSVKGVILVVYFVTNNISKIKPIINNLVKRFNARTVDNKILFSTFDCASYITVSKNCNLNQAMEDAIMIDAQDVEEVNNDDSTYFMFKSEFLHPEKTKTQLENLGYTIVSIENRAIPLAVTELTEKELESIAKFKEKLESELNEIVKIDDNINLS